MPLHTEAGCSRRMKISEEARICSLKIELYGRDWALERITGSFELPFGSSELKVMRSELTSWELFTLFGELKTPGAGVFNSGMGAFFSLGGSFELAGWELWTPN